MGSIFWQLNDCWPVASWSSIDYYGRWKALQYYARRFYAPILVSPHLEDGSVKVYIVSDKTAATDATLRVRLMDFGGKVLLEQKQYVTIDPLASKVYLDWPLKKLADAGAADTARVFVVADLQTGGATDYAMNGTPVSRNLIYIAPVKQVQLWAAPLKAETTGQEGSYKVRITSPVLARDVYLSFGNLDVKVSDNYFDILPGESVEITVASAATITDIKAQMKVISLTDAFGPQAGTAVVSAAK